MESESIAKVPHETEGQNGSVEAGYRLPPKHEVSVVVIVDLVAKSV